METLSVENKSRLPRLSLFTWCVVLLVSDLPDAIYQAAIGEPPGWLFWIKIGLLVGVILISLVWQAIRVVRPYWFLLLVLMLALQGMELLRASTAYTEWEKHVSWTTAMTGFELLKLAVTLIMVAVLLIMGRRWKDFFFSWGQPGEPVRSAEGEKKTGKRSISWGVLGLILGLCIAPLTLLFFGMGNLPPSNVLLKALPYFPAALLFAAMNAFSEEVQYRAALLNDLERAIGADQAIWLTATFFGFQHYFGGSPDGIPGVLIAGLLGALFARCMVGSKGILVPWFIHFCQNAIIFAFGAIGSVK